MNNKTLRVIMFGGLGDVLLTSPVFKAIKEKDPKKKIIVFCVNKKMQLILKNNPYINRITSVSFWENPISFIRYYRNKKSFFNTFYGAMQPTLFCNKNVKEIIADLYNVTLADKKVQIYLSDEENRNAQESIAAYRNPIVLHITSRTTSNQEWPVHNWNELVASMPEYTFLQVGLKDEKPIENAVDLRGKTSIRETFGLIKYARSFAGVNSIYSHATNAFDIPGVVVWGPAQPVIWGHENNINIYKAVRCSPCLDLILGHPCPYDKFCMTGISVDEVRTALLNQLKHASTPTLYFNKS